METAQQLVLDTPNFYVTEHFLYSDFICPCCDSIKLIPGFYNHVSKLESMRKAAGFPIIVTSGYRCKSHNKTVGGSVRSWHLLFATDIQPENCDSTKLMILYELALAAGFGGIGHYESFLHLDLRTNPMQWRG